MKLCVSLFTFSCIVISSAILPVEPPVEVDPPINSDASNICSLPSVTGPCRAAFQRYYYNEATGSCERFTYGGCKGNENNFETKEECLAKCKPDEADVCSLPSVSGPCLALGRRYFYNKATGSCEQFDYGGCEGNENNFETKEQCLAKCKPDEADVCSLPSVLGPCLALFGRHFYNKATGSCEQFDYGGCKGNANVWGNIIARKCKICIKKYKQQ